MPKEWKYNKIHKHVGGYRRLHRLNRRLHKLILNKAT